MLLAFAQRRARPLAACLTAALCASPAPAAVWVVPAPTPAAPVGRLERVVLWEDFSGATLDPQRWRVAKRQWGGEDVNGGVIPQNVQLCDGFLVLRANGDLYDGPLRGINRDGSQRPDGKRTGGAIATNRYFASGRFDVRARIVPEYGAASAFWTFHYTEVYDPTLRIGNHEIDIELPGRPGSEFENISFEWALFNTWTGVLPWQYTIGYTDLGAPQNNGQFHTYRFDWHTGDAGQTQRVEFFVDGALRRTTTTDVPTRAGRYWIGAWFPDGWAGDPAFDSSALWVDWVRITAFGQAGDEFVDETYPDHGWADVSEYPHLTDDRDGDGVPDGCDDDPDAPD